MNKKVVIQGVVLIIIIFVLCLFCFSCGTDQKLSVNAPSLMINCPKLVEIDIQDDINKPAAESKFTQVEIELLSRVIMSEAGILPIEGKIAVLSTIMNRVYSDKFPDTIYDVITQEHQYSMQDNGEPNDECYKAIDSYTDGEFPYDMFYFRTKHPHSFGYFFKQIGNTYFSTESDYGNQN